MMYSSALVTLAIIGVFAPAALAQIQCGDNSTFCPSGSTCCPLDVNTHYGCCPIPDAVCCEDKLHCCPSGTQCDVAHAQCLNGQVRLPMHRKFGVQEKADSSHDDSHEDEDAPTRLVHKPKKVKSRKHKKTKVSVPLEASRRECTNGDTCSGESTCCYDRVDEEAYCCPTRNAKCCPGARKCCPHGYTCAAYGEECKREENGIVITVTMLETKLAQRPQTSTEEADATTCPDKTRCSPQSTCCRTNYDDKPPTYRCCPLTNAVCCGMHCCPLGYRCTQNGQCEKSGHSSAYGALFN